MPDADNNFGGSLDLDFRKWWRNVQPKNSSFLDDKNLRLRMYNFVLPFASSYKQLIIIN